VEIPEDRRSQAARMAQVLGSQVYDKYPFVPGMGPVAAPEAELVLNRTWRPALSVTGMGGMPALADAGNVLRPSTTAKLSLRLPPGLDGDEATARVRALLEADPPYGAQVTFTPEPAASGWNAPPFEAWLERGLEDASQALFGEPSAFMGEGGTIPFMAMLGDRFPEAQFLITGVLGPGSNAHGPNEFLEIPTAVRLTAAVAQVIAAHARRG
jgi:acetylornithine deacetylase/succinyl-diaminopimelate desuccinylase-like protein